MHPTPTARAIGCDRAAAARSAAPMRWLASLLALAATAGAFAQPPTAAQQSAIKSACRADYRAVCASVQPGGPEALQCLQRNAQHVSPACQSALAAAGGGTAASDSLGGTSVTVPGAAAPESAGSPPMQGGASSMPMRERASSTGMREATPMRQELRLTRQACGRDFRKFCQGVQPGGGHAITCLEANAPSISPECRQALASIKGGAGK